MAFIAKWLVGSIAVGVAVWLVPGIEVVGGTWAAPIFTALFLAIVNALVKPVLKVLGFPLTVISLGLFLLVINAFMLELAGYLSRNITHAGILVDGFGAALLGAVIVSVVSMMLGRRHQVATPGSRVASPRSSPHVSL